ncbi:NAD-dependent epimerase/dehydratase family protein [Gulosibacter bifidus]|uniref:NAD-dependent epimerase/dehydratase family protein n=1 Tax=Gulosibacter bifidus TaxID=272239 RepID=A0ABW5RJB3_9MICO|nr:NAD-dependent epimerase/dehydratase family protein [Gulosibacter bifidus]
MKIAILGGDGFCGWPTSLHLSNLGHDVVIVDNLSRRRIDEELGANSLTPIQSIEDRIAAWHEVSGKTVEFKNIDVAQDYDALLSLIVDDQVDAIVHFAEQRAAPYSMKSPKNKRYTVDNNVNATNNVLTAIVESGRNVHLVHLGTMGVYGYGTAGMKIPEGYLDIEVVADEDKNGNPAEPHRVQQQILYPTNPGSVYHLTKVLDQNMFAYFAKNDQLRITDLHQGIVWGTNTRETAMDERLVNRFDYDGDYGTVLNRFLMQAAVGYPLTVHGTGGQTRAFIHIQDTVRCIEIALNNPPTRGDRVMIFNQMTETHRVRDLAALIAKIADAKVENVPNPRNEAAENELHVRNDTFLDLGLNPTKLAEGLLLEVTDIARKYADRADRSKIPATSLWTSNQQAGVPASVAGNK